jgi:hypothetical protein
MQVNYNIPYNLTLVEETSIAKKVAKRDIVLNQIERQIKAKKELLIKKYKQLKNKEEINEFLQYVKKDYNEYYNYIINEKEQQILAMKMLKEHLDNLINSEKLLNNQLQSAKIDQQYILNEMNKIKEELDEIISSN